MYQKPEFAATSRADIERVINEHSFGMLITVVDQQPVITHLAFVYERDHGEFGALVSHMAAANPQAQAIADGAEATAVFRGLHGYISPSWLSERTHTAPTWNYEAVECRGQLQHLASDRDAARSVADLVNDNERGRPNAWRMGELGAEGVKRRLPKIVCFRLPIANWQTKFKMHQDEWLQDVVEAGERLRQDNQASLAERMAYFNRGRSEEK